MKLRLARTDDLPQLRVVFDEIIENMNRQNIEIYWDEVYPYNYFVKDIEKKHLYILEDNGVIAAAFAVSDSFDNTDGVQWQNNDAKAAYLERLGVNVKYRHKGVSSEALSGAVAVAASQGAEYLRLFVVDVNIPAVKLYEKFGFGRADGLYYEPVDDFFLPELCYEIKTTAS